MMITLRNPEAIHPPLAAYSHHADVAGSYRWLVMAGQVGRRIDGIVPADPIQQIQLALENVRRNLEAADMGKEDLVKLTWYLVGEIDSSRRRELVGEWLGEHKPCSTLLYVAGLAAPEYRVEVDAWACKSDS